MSDETSDEVQHETSEATRRETSEATRRETSRRGMLVGAGIAGAAALALVGAPGVALADDGKRSGPNGWRHGPRPTRPTGFVTVRNGAFQKDGKAWRFGGTNCYYLHASSHYMVDSVLNNAAQMKLQVVRCWAFNDDPSKPDVALQTAPYTWPDDNYDCLDYAIYKAGQLGLRLVMPVVNNWPDYGGMFQYVSWATGIPKEKNDVYSDDPVLHDSFYTDPKVRRIFLAYVSQLITRRNRYTGIRYCDDPTIMTWELANEPRNRSDKSGAGVRNWADAVSRYIKRLAPRQLVAVGDEGMGLDPSSSDYPYSTYEGGRAQELTGLPAIDYATAHLYPGSWGETPDKGVDPVAWGARWITAQAAAAKKANKPLVLEEFGLQVKAEQGIPTEAARIAAYRTWLDTVYATGTSGFQFWILTALTDAGVLYDDYDGFRVVYPSDAATLMTQQATRLAAT